MRAHRVRSYPRDDRRRGASGQAGGDELMVAYHDEEWGVSVARRPSPVRAAHARGCPGRALVEDHPAQARGLPPCVRRLRSGEAVARFGAKDVERLLADPGIVRNRAEGRVHARTPPACSRCRRSTGASSRTSGRSSRRADREPLAHALGASSRDRPVAALSKELKRRASASSGRRCCYAFMQTVGMVNDHTVDCFRYAELDR